MTETPIQRVLARLTNVKQRTPNDWSVRCPAHDDDKQSLSVTLGEGGKVLLKCFAGCDNAVIVERIGLTLSDLFTPVEKSKTAVKRIVATYDYTDEAGKLLYQAVRYDPKEFRQRRPDGRGGWVWNITGVQRTLYRLPDVLSAITAGVRVYIVEGEKDADNLAKRGLCATTNAGGADKWQSSFTESLRGAHLVLIPDNDDPGRKHMQRVAGEAAGVAASVTVLELPGLKPKGDVSDWLAAGGTAERLGELVEAAPEWSNEPEEAPSDTPALRTFSDTDNAARFVAEHEQTLRYDGVNNSWFFWDGRRWLPDVGGEKAQEAAKATVRTMYRLAIEQTEDDKRKPLIDHARWSDRSARISAMMNLAKSDPALTIHRKPWDSDPWALNCLNGTLDLRTSELKPHDRNDHITKLCPVVYDPEATAPTWEKALLTWQPIDRIRDYLRRAAGYSLTGCVGEETAQFLFGDGRNGKSKFTGALEDVMGDYAARVNIDVLMDVRRAGNATPDLIPLVGARLVIASEIMADRRLNEAFLKDITGGDPITARANYGNTFRFRPQFKLWLYGNHKPRIVNNDEGIWSRLPLIPFSVVIPKEQRDSELSAKLKAESRGILAWMVRGCREWQQERLSPPAEVLEATAAYREEMDALSGFFRTKCVFVGTAWSPVGQLRKAYESWAQEEGIGDRALMNGNQFAARLVQCGCKLEIRKIDKKTLRGYIGIALREETDAETPDGYGGYGGYGDSQKSPHYNNMGKVNENDVTGVTAVTNQSSSTHQEKIEYGEIELEDLEDPWADDSDTEEGAL